MGSHSQVEAGIWGDALTGEVITSLCVVIDVGFLRCHIWVELYFCVVLCVLSCRWMSNVLQWASGLRYEESERLCKDEVALGVVSSFVGFRAILCAWFCVPMWRLFEVGCEMFAECCGSRTDLLRVWGVLKVRSWTRVMNIRSNVSCRLVYDVYVRLCCIVFCTTEPSLWLARRVDLALLVQKVIIFCMYCSVCWFLAVLTGVWLRYGNRSGVFPTRRCCPCSRITGGEVGNDDFF
jgi:hypothetical protein